MATVEEFNQLSTKPIELSLNSKKLGIISKALSSGTRRKIIKIIGQTPSDVSNIAGILGQTEANISAQISILQKTGLVSCRYQPGIHGVRKICSLSINKIEITLF